MYLVLNLFNFLSAWLIEHCLLVVYKNLFYEEKNGRESERQFFFLKIFLFLNRSHGKQIYVHYDF